MAYSYDDDGYDGYGAGSSGLDGGGAGGLGGYDSADLYSGGSGGLDTRDYDSGYDTLGSGGLGLDGLDDRLGGLSLNITGLDGLGGGLGSSGLYDSGYDTGLSGGSGADGGLGSYGASTGLMGSTYDNLDSYGTDRLGESGLGSYSGLESGLGGLSGSGYDTGLSGAFDGLGGSSYDTGLSGGLGASAFDSGLLGDTYGSGLDGLGSSGLSSYDTLGGIGSSSLSGYDTLGSFGSGGLSSGLDGGLGLGSDLGSASLSNYDYSLDSGYGLGSGLGDLDGLGWSTNDSGIASGLGSLGGFDGSDLLGGAALAAGGAALGAGAMAAYDRHHDRDLLGSSSLGYDSYGSGYDTNYGTGYGSGLSSLGSSASHYGRIPGGLYGDSLYDRDIGLLGHTSFGYGAYDGFGSGLGSAGLQYADLAGFESRLYANNAYNDIERNSIMRDRLAFDALDDAARASQWSSYSPTYRSRLGLDTGYYSSQYGGGLYDPSYSAFGYSNVIGSDYSGYNYSYGYGNPNYYDYSESRLPYAMTGSVRNYYSDYFGPSHSSANLPYWSDDSRFREAADLAYYQQRLHSDAALSEAERMSRWQMRLEWEGLDSDARRLRWQQMAENDRQRIGLGAIGSWYGSLYSSAGYGSSLPYELPSSLRSVYSPYMSGRGTSSYMDLGYARYNDLLAWSNAMRYDQNLRESDRVARWRRRLEFEQLDDLERRTRWNKMSYADRSMLGLAGGYWDSRLGLSNYYDPAALRPMQFPVSSTLARVFKPYQSKSVFSQALRRGEEVAVAMADLVAFENALRADRRLRDEDKLRRWKARVRWQELNEQERRIRFYRMQEAERRMLGLGLSSFFGRRYSAPVVMNGTRGLPPPRTALPTLRTQLPSSLQQRFAPVLQRQPNLAAAAALARQPNLATSELSRSLAGPDPTRDLANRIRLSIAQKKEQMPGLSQSQRLAATQEKRAILQQMDNDRRLNASVQMSEQDRMNRLRQLGQ